MKPSRYMWLLKEIEDLKRENETLKRQLEAVTSALVEITASQKTVETLHELAGLPIRQRD